jgi:hypothetical protein
MLMLWQEAVQNAAHQAAATRPPEWWEIISGVLAIPATLLGLAYSYVLIQKTRYEIPKVQAETQKLELEIQAQRKELSPAATAMADAFLKETIQPALDLRRFQLLFLRFLVLYLLLSVWPIIKQAVYAMVVVLAIGLGKLLHMDLKDQTKWYVYPFVLIAEAPDTGYWIVLFLLGWPLIRDTSSLLRISLREALPWNIFKQARKTSQAGREKNPTVPGHKVIPKK